jgi:hypothetical protein
MHQAPYQSLIVLSQDPGLLYQKGDLGQMGVEGPWQGAVD